MFFNIFFTWKYIELMFFYFFKFIFYINMLKWYNNIKIINFKKIKTKKQKCYKSPIPQSLTESCRSVKRDKSIATPAAENLICQLAGLILKYAAANSPNPTVIFETLKLKTLKIDLISWQLLKREEHRIIGII